MKYGLKEAKVFGSVWWRMFMKPRKGMIFFWFMNPRKGMIFVELWSPERAWNLFMEDMIWYGKPPCEKTFTLCSRFHWWTFVKYPWDGIVEVFICNAYVLASVYVNPNLSIVPLARGWSLWGLWLGGKHPWSLLFCCDAFEDLCSREQWKNAWNKHLVDCCLKEKIGHCAVHL